MKGLPVALLERLMPLLLGLGIGMLLVEIMERLPFKWAVFLVAALAGLSVFILIGTFSNHLRGGLLFMAALSLPAFYDINFMYRDNVKFSVLANGFPINLCDVFLAPLVLMWLYERWTHPQHEKLHFPVPWLLVMSGLLAINLYSALFVASEPFFSYSMIFVQVKCYLMMIFLANYLRNEHAFRVLGYAFAAILIFEGLVVFEQAFIGVVFTAENLGRLVNLKTKTGSTTLVRLAGTLNHPNDLAMYINLCLPWTCFMLLIEKKPVRRFYLITAIVLAVIAEVWTGSRGGWLGLVIAIGLGSYFWLKKQGKNPFVGMATMAFIVITLFSVLMIGSQTFRTRIVEGDARATEVRYPLMEVAMEMIRGNPMTGVGLNLYTREMVPYDRTNDFIAYRYNHPVHNTFLMVGAETGLPAMVLLCLFILLLIKESHRVLQVNQGVVATFGAGMLGTLVCWTIHNQVNLTAPYNDLTLWMLLGILAAAKNFTDLVEWNQSPAVQHV